jgi:WD40 repeat protein
MLRTSLLLLAFAASASADLFVSSFSHHSVRRYDDSGVFLGTFIAAGSGGLNAPHRGIFGLDGNFYVASANNDRILRYHGHTGAFMDVFIQNGSNGLPLGTLDYPVDMAFGPDGALYVSSQLNDSILRFNAATGAFIDVFVSSGSGGLDGPSGLGFLNGDLFVAGRFNLAADNHVFRYDGATGAFELALGAGTMNTAYGLDFGPDGNLYVASGGSSKVVKITGAHGASPVVTDFVATGSGGLSSPIGIEFGADGNLYAASFNTDSVKEYSGATGAPLGDFVTAGSGGLDQPNFMTFAVPEPGAPLLLGLGAMLLAQRRRVSAAEKERRASR